MAIKLSQLKIPQLQSKNKRTLIGNIFATIKTKIHCFSVSLTLYSAQLKVNNNKQNGRICFEKVKFDMEFLSKVVKF